VARERDGTRKIERAHQHQPVDFMSFAICNLVQDDYEQMEEMFYCVFPDVEVGLKDAFKYRVKNLSKGIYLDSGELVGFILCDIYGETFNAVKVNYIVVHPAYQKNGLGSMLLEHILRLSKRMAKNVILIPVQKRHILQWYRKKGFRISKVTDAQGGGKLYEMTYAV
jgi:GNAT superfamily N-acetyltransferase